MIYNSGLDSVVESIYMGCELSTNLSKCDIFVNPSQLYYLRNKIIIVSSNSVDLELIKKYESRDNIVISRLNHTEFFYCPYDLEVNNSLRCSSIQDYTILSTQIGRLNHSYDSIRNIYYFNRPLYFFETIQKGSLTWVGYLSHQMGVITEDMYLAGINQDYQLEKSHNVF